jgi:hypothetical protein
MRKLPLNEGKPTTADANGRAVITFQPLRAGEDWRITRTSIQNTGTTNVPEVRVYRGVEAPTALVEGTFSGNMDTSDTEIHLRNGEQLLVVWSGADANSSCSATVDGERTVAF